MDACHHTASIINKRNGTENDINTNCDPLTHSVQLYVLRDSLDSARVLQHTKSTPTINLEDRKPAMES